MVMLTSELLEIRQEDDALSGWLAWPGAPRPIAGQYLLARAVDVPAALPAALYACGWQEGRVQVAGIPAGWQVGAPLALRGPLGRGFSLPASAARVALAALSAHPARLRLLMQAALARGASVAFYADAVPPGLPDEVEVLPLNLLPEAPAWADYLAVEMDGAQARAWRRWFNLRFDQLLACPAEALVGVPMPCGEAAGCGLCAVETHSGWKLACKDGPVFALASLAVD